MEKSDKYIQKAVLKQSDTVSVCLVEHVRLKQLRIIKTVCTSSEQSAALLSEALFMQQLRHPCIPEIYDIEERPEEFSVIEEYIPGDSLTSYIQKNHLTIHEVILFSIQLCELLEYLHEREIPVYHLDLKPDNLIVRDGQLFLIDFGSAREQKEFEQRQTLTGTPGYAAPECYRGFADAASDLYSVGKIMEFMLEHCIRSRGHSRERAKLKKICDKVTSDKLSERYPSAKQICRRLHILLRRGSFREHKRCIVIGFAGSGRRVGVTRFALWYLGYLRKQGWKTLYLECNASGVVHQLTVQKQKRKEIKDTDDTMFAEARASMERDVSEDGYGLEWERQYYEKAGYQVILADFGTLTKEKRTMFLQSDDGYLLSGGRFWEEENLWKALSMLTGAGKDIMLLMSFLNRKECSVWSGRVPDRICRRIPYIAKQGRGTEWREMIKLFDEMTERWEEKTWG